MRKEADPLTNWGTSKVFYAMILGSTTPKEIAEDLDITPPAVIDQLRRLQKIGIVRLGSKTGKFQNYEVDWTKFCEVLLDRSPRLNEVFSVFSRELHGPPKPSHTRWGSDLCRNNIFQNLVMGFFNDAAKTSSEEEKVTLNDLISHFEEALIGLYPFLKTEKVDEEIATFLSLLESWYGFAERYNPFSDVLIEAFKKMKALSL